MPRIGNSGCGKSDGSLVNFPSGRSGKYVTTLIAMVAQELLSWLQRNAYDAFLVLTIAMVTLR